MSIRPRPSSGTSIRTSVVTSGRPDRVPDAPLNQPIVPASTFVAGGPIGYGRYGNPAWSALEESIGLLEGGSAITFSSGMAAAQAILDLVTPGGRLVLAETCYLGVSALADRLTVQRGLLVERVPVDDVVAIAAAAPGADLVWLESPTNPLMEVADIPAVVATLADLPVDTRPRLVIDNTFASPILQRPLEHGADVVLHSATKLLSGHSDAVLGAVVTRHAEIADAVRQSRTLGGATPGALETFLVHRGLRTLALRVATAQDSATVLASRLAGHPAVQRVRHPGWGSLLSIELADAATADAFAAATRIWVNATSLGGVESTLERRRRWASELPRVPDGLVRMSVGIEDVEDLWQDLEQALARPV